MDNQKRKYKIDECRRCGHKFEQQADFLECPTCHTVYDLVNRKTDTSKTILAPYECKHWAKHHLCGMEGRGEREHVSICLDCGTIFVSAVKDGVWFNTNFNLSTDKAVAAAGKFNTLCKADQHPRLLGIRIQETRDQIARLQAELATLEAMPQVTGEGETG